MMPARQSLHPPCSAPSPDPEVALRSTAGRIRLEAGTRKAWTRGDARRRHDRGLQRTRPLMDPGTSDAHNMVTPKQPTEASKRRKRQRKGAWGLASGL
jgi:hypothetical protein